LVSDQIDIDGDGILGKNFLQRMQARICYRENILELRGETFNVSKTLLGRDRSGRGGPKERQVEKIVRTITLPRWSETVVQIWKQGKQKG
jgi:hypothetical protein